jgi:hypothetical protein
MYMPEGGLCVEIEAVDPSHLYYDHHATFQELCDIYSHAFVRSTPADDDSSSSTLQPIIGSVRGCRDECLGPLALRSFNDQRTVNKCFQRCAKVFERNRELARQPDAYRRSRGDSYESWFMNWWLADTAADVDAVAELVTQLACLPREPLAPRTTDAIVSASSSAGGSAASASEAVATDQKYGGADGSSCAVQYEPSEWELSWAHNVATWQGDDLEWRKGCAAMRAASDKVQVYLRYVARRDAEELDTPLQEGVFSAWRCHATSPLRMRGALGVPIEPLVGHLRHPEFHCIGPSRDACAFSPAIPAHTPREAQSKAHIEATSDPPTLRESRSKAHRLEVPPQAGSPRTEGVPLLD